MSNKFFIQNTHLYPCTNEKFVLVGECEFYPWLASQTIKGILKSKQGPFAPSSKGHLRLTKVGRLVQRLPKCALIWRPDRQFEPVLKLFLEEYAKHPIRGCADMLPSEIWTTNGERVYEVWQDFVKKLRKKATQTRVYKRQSDWESKYAKARDSFMELEAACFEARSRCMVVFCSFYLKKQQLTPKDVEMLLSEQSRVAMANKQTFDEGGELMWSPTTDALVPLAQLQGYREKFFADKKKHPEIFDHMLGYAWGIEYAPKTGYHLHAVFIFDGSKTHQPGYWGQLLGKHWSEVTDGAGWSHNSNFDWDEDDPNCGIGNIHHSDTCKRNNLRRTLKYLCKTKQMVPVLPKEMTNLFGKMQPPPRDLSKGGAPRVALITRSKVSTTTGKGAAC